jgi:hypothetical protein
MKHTSLPSNDPDEASDSSLDQNQATTQENVLIYLGKEGKTSHSSTRQQKSEDLLHIITHPTQNLLLQKKIRVLVIVFIALTFLVFLLYNYSTDMKVTDNTPVPDDIEVAESKWIDINDASSSNFEPTYEDSLKSLCKNTIWQENLYINCTNIIHDKIHLEDHGRNWGTVNIRNTIVTCLRWAIDAGMGFVMPRIATRSDYDLIFFPGYANYAFMFDEDHLRKSLQEQCPQLKIMATYEKANAYIQAPILEEHSCYNYSSYRKHISKLLAKHGIASYSSSTIVIRENNPLFGWAFYQDGKNIHNSLLTAVRFRSDITEFAKDVLTIIPDRFIGLHLRAEPDNPWYTYDQLTSWFLEGWRANYSDIKHVYVSVGSQKLEDQFRLDLKKQNITVYSKHSLSLSLRNKIELFNFDQIAIVDFEVLIQSSAFFGVSESSFSYAVAFERGKGIMENCGCHTHGSFFMAFRCCY